MSDSFRTMQAVSDLVHHVKPLLAQHLAAVAEASGMTLRETGEAFARLRDDGFRFQRDETLPLLDGLETIAISQAEGFDLAVVVLLADVLQRGQVSGLLSEAWDEAVVRLRNWPATLRAAMANGFRRAAEAGSITLEHWPRDADHITRQKEEIAPDLLRIARAIRIDELLAVAKSYSGQAVEARGQILIDLIGLHDGIEHESIRVVPEIASPWSEVAAIAESPGAVGFEGCTAILLLNAVHYSDRRDLFGGYWEAHGEAYCRLRPSARDPILAAVRYMFELNTSFIEHSSVKCDTGYRAVLPIPVVDDL